MNAKTYLSIAAVLSLGSLAFLPVASASHELGFTIDGPDCVPEDPLYRRAVCAAYDTAIGALGAADPVFAFANEEYHWAEQQAEGWVVFVNEKVVEACAHVTGLCQTLEMVETTLLA